MGNFLDLLMTSVNDRNQTHPSKKAIQSDSPNQDSPKAHEYPSSMEHQTHHQKHQTH
jgi:hypothetical protein